MRKPPYLEPTVSRGGLNNDSVNILLASSCVLTPSIAALREDVGLLVLGSLEVRSKYD